MKRLAIVAAIIVGSFAQPALAQSDAVIKAQIIKASKANYSGNCPCPESVAANGSRCGGRSAWSRAGGYSPKCYPSDVTAAEVRAWRLRKK